MRNKILYYGLLLVAFVAMWGIFSLIFPAVTTLMVLNAVSGMLMLGVLSLNFLMTTSLSRLTVKNAATLNVLNWSAVGLFVWTLVFTFLLGDYNEEDRVLKDLCIGYLVIVVLTAICIVMADRGATYAEEHNTKFQEVQDCKAAYVDKLQTMQTSLLGIDPNPRSDVNKSLSQCVSKLRAIPVSRFQIENIVLTEKIETLQKAIEAKNVTEISAQISSLYLSMSNIR